MAQLYYSPISINAGQVPSTQTDFPMLVSVTDARFKTTGNGGHVANANGYDIRPYSDSGLTTAITGYELERYNASTGEVVMWVKRSSLADGNVTYLGYGDTSLTTDGSSTTTWSNNFISVYHLKDGSTLSVTDSTGNHNGTNHSATAAPGQIDGAAAFASVSSQYIDGGSYAGPTQITLSAWVKATSFPNAYNCVVGPHTTTPGNSYSIILVKSTGKLAMFCFRSASGDISYDGTGTNTLSAGTWYHIALTYDKNGGGSAPGLVGYFNGGVDKSVNSSTADLVTNTASTYIGQDAGAANRFWNGSLDEVRLSSVARSANWITTEYNNQSAPGTFATLGTEVALGAANRPAWFVFFG